MIEVTKEKDYWLVKLNRPEAHNAFHPEMIEALTKTYQEAANAKGLYFIFMSGEGKSFSAGADLNWMKDMANYTEEQNYQDALKLFDMFYAIYSCPLPTIAYAHGNVFGGALGMLACQDYVISEKDTKFCFSEVKWGLSPATISPFVMAKIGLSTSLRYMLSAEIFKAKEAKKIHLIHEIVEEKEKKDYLKNLSQSFLNHGLEALLATKKIIRKQAQDPKDYREASAKLIAERRVSKEGQEGLNFFVSKEKPSWKKDKAGVLL